MRAWDSFLDRHGALARAIAKNVAPATTDVDDVVQEATAAILEQAALTPERFRDASFARNYFLRTVRNLALREGRRPRALSISVEQEAPASHGSASRGQELLLAQHGRRLQASLQALEPDERELLMARFRERLTLKQISDRTGHPISTLHSRERALLRKLRARLAPHARWEESA